MGKKGWSQPISSVSSNVDQLCRLKVVALYAHKHPDTSRSSLQCRPHVRCRRRSVQTQAEQNQRATRRSCLSRRSRHHHHDKLTIQNERSRWKNSLRNSERLTLRRSPWSCRKDHPYCRVKSGNASSEVCRSNWHSYWSHLMKTRHGGCKAPDPRTSERVLQQPVPYSS